MTTQPAEIAHPTPRAAAWLDRARDTLPRGRTLPEAAWRRRHRWLLGLLWLHVPVIVAYGLVADSASASPERHGGRMWVDDGIDGGSAFRFWLPDAHPSGG